MSTIRLSFSDPLLTNAIKSPLWSFSLIAFTANDKKRNFKDVGKMITTVPKEEELTEILVSFFKESGIERGVKNWRNSLDIYIDSLEEWDDIDPNRRKRLLDSFYPELDHVLQRAINHIETKLFSKGK